jgi:hypothetical protein
LVYREPGSSTPRRRISNLVPHYRPANREGPSPALHPRPIADGDREPNPFTRFINSFRIMGFMIEALLKNTLFDEQYALEKTPRFSP